MSHSGLTVFLAVSLLSGALLSSCSPLYLVRAAYEEGRILWRREPIEGLLQTPDLNPDTEEKFRLVLAVREYARDQLKLNVGGSYASYSYVDRPVLSYVLMAVPKADLNPYTWWFVVVGEVPYKAFFSKQAAHDEAERFHARGYDTYIRTAPAFSTLGWFDDPLLAHLLKYDTTTLAEVIFHELFHNTLFVKGEVNFNESLANFVGNQAAVQFFRDRFGEGSPAYQKAKRAWEEEMEFSAFLAELARSLRELYGRNDLSEDERLRLREEIFSSSQQVWTRRIAGRSSHRHRGFIQEKLNNAVIAHYLLYLKNLDVFESLYEAESEDLPRLVEVIRSSIRGGKDPFKAVSELTSGKRS